MINAINIQDLNPLNDIRNRITITLPYSKEQITIYEPTVRNKTAILNQLSSLFNKLNKEDEREILSNALKELIKFTKNFVNKDIMELETTEITVLVASLIEFLAYNWLLKINVKCNKCNNVDNINLIFKPEDDVEFINDVRKINNIEGVGRYFNLEFKYNTDYKETEFKLDLDKGISLIFKLGYPKLKYALSEQLIPLELQYIRDFKFYKQGTLIFDLEKTNRLEYLLDLPDTVINILKEKIEETKYEPIKAVFQHICPKCGNKEEIQFDPLSYFLVWLQVLDNLTLESTT